MAFTDKLDKMGIKPSKQKDAKQMSFADKIDKGLITEPSNKTEGFSSAKPDQTNLAMLNRVTDEDKMLIDKLNPPESKFNLSSLIKSPLSKDNRQDIKEGLRRNFNPTEAEKKQNIEEMKTSKSAAFGLGLANGATLGLNSKLLGAATGNKEGVKELETAVKANNKAAYFAGDIAGSITPWSAAESLVTKVGGKALQKVGSELGKRIIVGGTAGALTEGVKSGVEGNNAKKIATDALVGGAMGGAGEVLAKYLGDVGKVIFNKLKTKKPLTDAEKEAVSSSPDLIKMVRDEFGITDEGFWRKTNPIDDKVNPLIKGIRDDLGVDTRGDVFVKNNLSKQPAEFVTDDVIRSIEPQNTQSNINLPLKEKTAQNGLQGNIDTARAKVNYKPKEKSKFDGLFTRLRTQLVDRYAPLEKLEKGIRGKLNSAESSLYKQARLFEGVPEKANLIIDTELKPIIKNIEKSGYSYKDLGLYAEMVHARDVNAAGMKSGFSEAEINDVIQKLGTEEMENARKQLMLYNDKRLKSLVEGNLISPEQYTSIREKWRNYMPLNRVFEDDKIDFVSNLGKSFVNVGKPIDKLTGSTRDIIDPIESMIKNTYRIENAIGKNKVGLQLSKLSGEDVENKFIRKISEGEATDRKNIVNITEKGVKVKYEVEPEVYKALKNMDKESSNMLIKIFQAPASVLRAGATLTPEFATRNPIRDVFSAFVNSESGFNPFTDFAAGLSSYVRKGKLYEDFLKNNGGYGNIISMDRQSHRKVIEEAIKKPVYKKMVTVVNPKSWIKVMRYISDMTESATKIGEFRAALRSGATEQEAAYRARDLMDFARAGTSVKELNKVVAFLNANIQGKSKFIRAIKERPGKVIPKLFVSMALPSLGAYAAMHYMGNEDQKAQIKDAPNWLRDSFWLIPVPGTNTIARIPKPFEGAAVSNTIERFLQYTMDNDPEAFDNFITENIKQQSIPSMLTGITPILEGLTNYSLFRRAPIIPKREEYLQPQDQYDIYTSEISKGIAGLIQKTPLGETNFASPRIVENTIRGTTAGLGGYVLDTTDKLLGKNKPAKNMSQLPVLKGFTVNETNSGRSMEFVYNEKDKLTKEKNSLKLRNEKFDKQDRLKYLTKATEQIGDISKEIREIQNSLKLTPTEKRDKINPLAKKRNELARQAQKDYKSRW